ncbi:hypothetical protein ACFYSI_13125 [Staphylococcus xylosus]|uniref:hypothetical protein n=2 Tax=Staphylococcus TaxID=1279 RepID=UPI00369409EA
MTIKTTKEIAKDLRQGLKTEFGLNRNHVSVTKRSESALDVILKQELNIDYEAFRKYVLSFEDIDRDEITYEILSGANTIILISSDYE